MIFSSLFVISFLLAITAAILSFEAYAVYTFLIGIGSLGLFLVFGVVSLLLRPSIELHNPSQYFLQINAKQKDKIEQASDMAYAKNYLIHKTSNDTLAEIDRRQAYILMKDQSAKIEVRKKDLPIHFFQIPPNDMFNVLQILDF